MNTLPQSHPAGRYNIAMSVLYNFDFLQKLVYISMFKHPALFYPVH